jgi:hypothetical protein
MHVLHIGKHNWFRPHYVTNGHFLGIPHVGIGVQEGPFL